MNKSVPDTTEVIGLEKVICIGCRVKLFEPWCMILKNCELWHKRMVYLHHKEFPILRERVNGILEFNIEQYGVFRRCTLGKNAKVSFPSSEHRSKGILHLVQSDVCGLMLMESIMGRMYYVSFIDDFSHKTWMYLLNTKDEVFSRF